MQRAVKRQSIICIPRSAEAFLIGLMSGTSADGIDAVLVRFSRQQNRLSAQLLTHLHTNFPPKLRRRILTACLHGSVSEICELNFVLGQEFARAAEKVILACGIPRDRILAIGSHGQTVHHLPNNRPASTLQIGEPAVIAEQTGLPVVADFRVRDMAAGGQGAPLVPYADWALLTHAQKPRIVQNIGGIGNLTMLAPSGKLEDVLAFDTGPGNMVIDAVTTAITAGREKFDRNGRLAARGKVCPELLRECLKHSYLRRQPPKTTGREEFGELFTDKFLAGVRSRKLRGADAVATATMFTARTIVDAYVRHVFPRFKAARVDLAELEVIIGGGGALNGTLMGMLKDLLPGVRVLSHKDVGMPNEAKEALAFALLAFETLSGRPSNVPGATGARHGAVLGKIILP